MSTIALATCADLPTLVDDDASFLAALRDRGVTVEPTVWNDESVDWDRFDAVVVRSIWDYYRQPEAFAAWVETLAAADCLVWNTPETLRWNGHKFYLRDLEGQGISTLATEYVSQGSDVSLASVFAEHGWDELVAKPAVSAGAFETKRIARDAADAEQAWVDELVSRKDVLLQEFAADIGDGEWSLLFFDGTYSHALLKRPGAGDFRVQEKHGGSVHVDEPGERLREQARDVVDAVTAETGEEPLYARVDGIDRDGEFHLLEVELIEPELFFRVDDGAGDRLAEALLGRLEARRHDAARP